MKKTQIKRLLEIIPGTISWGIILVAIGLSFLKPILAAIGLIAYLLFWVCRMLYMSSLLVLAHHKMLMHRKTDWLTLSQNLNTDLKFHDVWHIVLYTIYKEPLDVIEASLHALRQSDYPKDRMIVILAGESRAQGSPDQLANIRQQFIEFFDNILITVHPADLPGEIPCKGANATHAARQARHYLSERGISLDHVILSCFDADTCPDKNYFSCLTYHFIRSSKRHQMSFQPLPIYSNNIYSVPAFARIVEIGSTFWQLMESMRHEKFVTFSSHSMSFKTLVEVGYWPVNMISDDSLIFWKCFLKFNGDYITHSLEVPVYMDIAVGRTWLQTIFVQYKQKRRWAWGVETFPFLGMRFFANKKMPMSLKIRKLFQILDSHINWATWSIILTFISPLLLTWGRLVDENALVFLNLSYINSVIFNSLVFILVLCMVISKEFIPPRPKNVSPWVSVGFVFQWFFLPFVSAILGSFPALDAQTRMMFKRDLSFFPTPKYRNKPKLPVSREAKPIRP